MINFKMNSTDNNCYMNFVYIYIEEKFEAEIAGNWWPIG